MRRIIVILSITLLVAFVAMGLRKSVFSPPQADAVRNQIADYSATQGWTWEMHSGSSSSGISGGPSDSIPTKALEAVVARTDEEGFDEYEFSTGSGTIGVRVEHADGIAKVIEITGTGVTAGTVEDLRRHLKAQPGWIRCRILPP